MFISRKRLNDMERRLTALEKQSNSGDTPLSEIRRAIKTALDNAAGQFEYELANADKSSPSSHFLVRL